MVDILGFIKELFFSWLSMFISFPKDFNVLWILIPIWISWFFTEFFQEKRGTGFGNAITNGAIPIWVAIDWARYLVNGISDGTIISDTHLYIKFGICGFIAIYGIFVIYEGLKTQAIAHIAGRIRVVTYILMMLTPVIYGVVPTNWTNILSIVVFFPLFYFIVELITIIIPDSKAYDQDRNKSTDKTPEKDFSSNLGPSPSMEIPSQNPENPVDSFSPDIPQQNSFNNNENNQDSFIPENPLPKQQTPNPFSPKPNYSASTNNNLNNNNNNYDARQNQMPNNNIQDRPYVPPNFNNLPNYQNNNRKDPRFRKKNTYQQYNN